MTSASWRKDSNLRVPLSPRRSKRHLKHGTLQVLLPSCIVLKMFLDLLTSHSGD